MDHKQSLSHTKWECKYHLVWIPKYRRKDLYKFLVSERKNDGGRPDIYHISEEQYLLHN